MQAKSSGQSILLRHDTGPENMKISKVFLTFAHWNLNKKGMEEKKKTVLPENASRELRPGEEYRPLLSPEKNYPLSALTPLPIIPEKKRKDEAA